MSAVSQKNVSALRFSALFEQNKLKSQRVESQGEALEILEISNLACLLPRLVQAWQLHERGQSLIGRHWQLSMFFKF